MVRASLSDNVNMAANITPIRVIQHTLIMVILSGILLILQYNFFVPGVWTPDFNAARERKVP